MPTKTNITDIADIIPGYSFRWAIEAVKDGKYFVLQAKDLKDGLEISTAGDLTSVSDAPQKSDAFLQENDIIIIAKGLGGSLFKAVVFTVKDTNVIATSSVYVLRIKDKNVLPEYLSIYLNSDDGQKSIKESAVGAYIKSISRKEFEKIRVPIPDLKIQESLVGLNRNLIQQDKINNRKRKLKKEILEVTIKNLNK